MSRSRDLSIQYGDLDSLETRLDLKLTRLHSKMQNEMREHFPAFQKSIENITDSNRSSQHGRFCSHSCSQSRTHTLDGMC